MAVAHGAPRDSPGAARGSRAERAASEQVLAANGFVPTPTRAARLVEERAACRRRTRARAPWTVGRVIDGRRGIPSAASRASAPLDGRAGPRATEDAPRRAGSRQLASAQRRRVDAPRASDGAVRRACRSTTWPGRAGQRHRLGARGREPTVVGQARRSERARGRFGGHGTQAWRAAPVSVRPDEERSPMKARKSMSSESACPDTGPRVVGDILVPHAAEGDTWGGSPTGRAPARVSREAAGRRPLQPVARTTSTCARRHHCSRWSTPWTAAAPPRAKTIMPPSSASAAPVTTPTQVIAATLPGDDCSGRVGHALPRKRARGLPITDA